MKITLQILVLILSLTMFSSCEVKFWDNSKESVGDLTVTVERYDRLQSRYLTNADFSALQSMNTAYPMETRALIENVLQLGTVDQHDINERFLKFYQDSTLLRIIDDIGEQYADMEDINGAFTKSFRRLQQMLPHMHIPLIYAQIGALNQSVVVGDSIVGICLDKYLGSNYSIYKKYYTDRQRESMSREYIVPDCLLFYIVSLYPLNGFEKATQEQRDEHIGRVMHAVNVAMDKKFYKLPHVAKAENYMKKHPHTPWDSFLCHQ